MKQRVEFNRLIELGELNGAHSITMSFFDQHEHPEVQTPPTHQVTHLHAWRYLPESKTLHLYPDYRLQDSIIGDMIDVDACGVLENVFYEGMRKYALAWLSEGNQHMLGAITKNLKKLVIHWPKNKLTHHIQHNLILVAAGHAVATITYKEGHVQLDYEVVGD